MKKSKSKILYSVILISNLYCFNTIISQPNQAVTNYLCKGRFGDKVISYVFAKWISYTFNIPLFVKPFPHSAMLRFSKEEKKYTKEVVNRFEKTVLVNNEKDVVSCVQDNILFENRGVYFRIGEFLGLSRTIEYIFQDQFFVTILKKMLQPIIPLPEIILPKDRITVAVHIRKGGGFDPPLYSLQHYRKKHKKFSDKQWPGKFPPEQYYVDQIKKISNLLNKAPLFIYIFTDDSNPVKLTERIKKAVGNTNIIFSCRKEKNIYNRHTIEDFYNISRFDCLIRSISNFATAAQLLGNHQIIIYPKHFKWVGRKLIVDEVVIVDKRPG